MIHTSRDTSGHGLALGYQWVHTSWYLQHQFQWWSARSAAAPPHGTSLYHAGPQLLYWCSQQRPWRLGIAWTRNLQHTRLTSAPNKTAVSKNATHRHTRVSHCLGMITMIVYHTIYDDDVRIWFDKLSSALVHLTPLLWKQCPRCLGSHGTSYNLNQGVICNISDAWEFRLRSAVFVERVTS